MSTDQAAGQCPVERPLGAGAVTMDSLYGDGSDHMACDSCGMCLLCHDCDCGSYGLVSCAGCGAPIGDQHMPNCPIEAPNSLIP